MSLSKKEMAPMPMSGDGLDALFHALSDPTRRAMLARLMQGPATVSDLARPFSMSMPTVLAHLARLEDGGLIRTEKRGRVRTCRANPVALAPARRWIACQAKVWQDRVAAQDARAPEPARTSA